MDFIVPITFISTCFWGREESDKEGRGGGKNVLLDSAKPPTYLWDLPWGFGISDPRGGRRGKRLEGPWSIRCVGGRKPGEGPCGAAQFPFDTGLEPWASLSVGKEGHGLGKQSIDL